MAWGTELGAVPVRPAAGAVLRLLATAASATHVVEVGTGTGASGLWLLAGMRPDGTLTTIDVEPEVQRLARQAYAAAGYAPARTRIITGNARDVLPRLADGGYDLVFLDGAAEDHPAGAHAAARILRPGGVLVVNRAIPGDNPAGDEVDAVIVRELVHGLRDDPRWLAVLLEAGDGLLCATRTGPDSVAGQPPQQGTHAPPGSALDQLPL
ncbi:MAG: O-methyltransferase [Micromonosporaceae bacterium]